MQFGQQIKDIRHIHNLTQEQLADCLAVTRQAVSNWENDRNLPDIEILIKISKTFNITLDELILNEQITQKLIVNTKENRKSKLNLFSTSIGFVILLIGLISLIIKSMSVEYIDEFGYLHENFFLIPIGLLLIFVGIFVIVTSGLLYWSATRQK